ncbi:MAG TPA: MFS transporter [Candidatus Limnocylindrales bacterium]|nr:MFS transporter [Candidatus Limnocylindrales bacterium]
MARLSAYLRSLTGFERDARRYLVVTLTAGAATSLYWIDFNLYLASLGLSTSVIGIVATAGSVAGALVAFPASALSDRVGRRLVIAGGVGLMAASVAGLLVVSSVPGLLLLAALYGAGQQTMFVVQNPYLVEQSRPEHRSELFAVQFALTNVTNIAAALLGAFAAAFVSSVGGLPGDGPETYRVILALMVGLLAVGLAVVISLGDDRPSTVRPRELLQAGEPAAFPANRRPDGDTTRSGVARLSRLGIVIRDRRVFVRLLLPGFLISVGAGQVIPFLNLFVQRKFGLDLAALNGVFALTSLGTIVAILLQPALARRLGRIRSVVVVQAASIPFLVVLGWSPLLWTVILALAVRNSLMNAGNPIFNAFAMDRVSAAERATLSAAMSLLWSLGWVVAGPYYSVLQATLGFDAGYAVNFVTIIVLYSVATALYWAWFREEEAPPGGRRARVVSSAR